MERQMKAAVYDRFGPESELRIEMVGIPEVKEGEVLVRIKAAAVNPVDAAVKEGHLKSFIPVEFPVIPGWDMAGIVEERGFSARRFEIGDEVYAYARRPVVRYGTFAEYIVIPETYLALKPKTLSFEEAAGIPLTGLTAFQCLIDAGHLQPGQTVLILGASGGIGTMGIQIAREKEATVIGVASAANHDFMRDLGADYTIDYNGADIGAEVRTIARDGVDLIFDAASGESLKKSIKALKPGGRLVSILHDGKDLPEGINFTYVFVEPHSIELTVLAQLADEGKLRVPVSATFTLEQVSEAMKQIETHHTRGKIVITP